MWGHVGRHFGDTCWSGRGHFFEIFGISWDVSGSGLGTFLDRFGKVFENMTDEVEKSRFSKMSRKVSRYLPDLQDIILGINIRKKTPNLEQKRLPGNAI